ncbi:hypothetical protein [Nocardioides sp.]|uniref:hypothetical protein n=1 Tax=Nocardioides sp. TaxID=35761 RepID=UPI0031FEC7E7|nr:hypothetical protein [Nocardioides sp.]
MSDAARAIGHRLALLTVVACLTAMLCVVVTYTPWPATVGSRVLIGADGHGIHVADLPAVGIWIAGMTACAYLWRCQQRG